jgi:hypothetical protein
MAVVSEIAVVYVKLVTPRRFDHIIVIVDGGVNHIVGTANKPKFPRNSGLR